MISVSFECYYCSRACDVEPSAKELSKLRLPRYWQEATVKDSEGEEITTLFCTKRCLKNYRASQKAQAKEREEFERKVKKNAVFYAQQHIKFKDRPRLIEITAYAPYIYEDHRYLVRFDNGMQFVDVRPEQIQLPDRLMEDYEIT